MDGGVAVQGAAGFKLQGEPIGPDPLRGSASRSAVVTAWA